MSFTLGIAQVAHPADGDPIGQVRRYAERASARGCDIVAFPESLMGPWLASTRSYLRAPEALDGPFCQAIDGIARDLGIWIVYTTEEAREDDPTHPYNTAVVTDDRGTQRLTYRKTHLYDAIGERESARMSAGDRLPAAVEAPFCRLGVAICYDLRFPEVARAMALAGAQLLLYPSAWVAGPRKVEQWRTLLAARAIENECFVAGVARTGDGRCGTSLVVGPLGETLACADTDECLLSCVIDPDGIDSVRAAMPIFRHRRPELYA